MFLLIIAQNPKNASIISVCKQDACKAKIRFTGILHINYFSE
jgi:hypothetical protein